jgi:hypothetical protein
MKATSAGFFFLSLVAAIQNVAAHGFVGQVAISGDVYKGNIPGGATNPSIIRQISDISPVKGATNPSMNCGLNSQLASQVAAADPGDVLSFAWVGGSDGGLNVNPNFFLRVVLFLFLTLLCCSGPITLAPS